MKGAVAGAALMIVGAPAALARTFRESKSGSDYERTTTLFYTNPHGNFNIEIWVTTSGPFVSKKYSIEMYDSQGRLVWSANNQVRRSYGIGGNVTKIVIRRNDTHGATTNWKR